MKYTAQRTLEPTANPIYEQAVWVAGEAKVMVSVAAIDLTRKTINAVDGGHAIGLDHAARHQIFHMR